MRALFLAVPGIAAARVLWRWLEAGHEVAGLWYPAGINTLGWRRDRLRALFNPNWSVSAALRRQGIAVRAVPPPARAEAEWLADIASLGADTLICCHFTYRITPGVLALFGHRAVNFHPSMLPAYRGPMPTLAMLLAGETDRYGGVSLHVLTPEFDTGAIIAATPLPCPAGATLLDWRLALARAAGELAAGPLPAYLDGRIAARPQDGAASYINVLPEELSLIDARWSAERVADTLRRLGNRHTLRVEGPDGRVTVLGLLRRLGPPTGQPVRKSRRHVAMDVADARILLATRERFQGWRWQRELMKIARAPV